jgi:hypothetical protein
MIDFSSNNLDMMGTSSKDYKRLSFRGKTNTAINP